MNLQDTAGKPLACRIANRAISLEDFIKKPRMRAKSKLSRELKIEGEEIIDTTEEDSIAQSESRPSTSNTQETSQSSSEVEDDLECAITVPPSHHDPEPHIEPCQTLISSANRQYTSQHFEPDRTDTTPSRTRDGDSQNGQSQTLPSIPLHDSPAIQRRVEPLEPQVSSTQNLQSCRFMLRQYLRFMRVKRLNIPPILRRHLLESQEGLDPVVAKAEALFISQQAILEYQRLALGQDPWIHQAKGEIISIYSCGDEMGELIGVAIKALHAPPGFPNQEIWLWESRRIWKWDTLVGNVVIFWIGWEMEENHWRVVDVRQ